MGEVDYFFYLGFVQLAIGSLLLLMGRRVFWLFVGGVGFFVGFQLGTIFFLEQPAWVRLLMGVGAGALGVVVMVFMQRAAIVYTGFLAGGYLLNSLWFMVGIPWRVPILLLFFIGGALGAVISYQLFDQVLIVMTALVGAVFIIEAIDVVPGWQLFLFALLTAVGVMIQGRQTAAPPAVQKG
ncbi:MAG TPA: hypothetical protein PLB05_01485 [Candidatus Omnitrophota bacterium]|nr:hypothetical protein [Candidatus Omnitrophota bacterium]HPN55619.1 hypothetical protein [Candidatus Omnitrophota bacterium]